jgi:hypothetical protein
VSEQPGLFGDVEHPRDSSGGEIPYALRPGTEPWVVSCVKLARSAASKISYDARLVFENGRDLRETGYWKRYQHWPKDHQGSRDWPDFCRTVLGANPGWIDFLIDSYEEIVDLDYGSAQEKWTTARGRTQGAAQATTGEVRPKGRVASDQIANLAICQPERAQEVGVSVATQKKLDRLARDRPDLLEKVQAGELSAHGAMKEAGFVKVKTPLDQLKRIWPLASKRERTAFLNWTENQEAARG